MKLTPTQQKLLDELKAGKEVPCSLSYVPAKGLVSGGLAEWKVQGKFGQGTLILASEGKSK